MTDALSFDELEMLFNCERSAWRRVQSALDLASVMRLVQKGFLIQDGALVHITQRGLEAAKSVRNGVQI